MDDGVVVPVVTIEEGTSIPISDSESKVVSVEYVQSGKELNGDSTRNHESSGSSLDEESRLIENPSEIYVGESVASVLVNKTIVDPVERAVPVLEEVELVAEATPDEIPEVSCDIEADPVENFEVLQVTETDSAENFGVAPVAEATVIENTGVVGGIDSPLVETKEEIALLSSEAVSEKPSESVECCKQSENPGSVRNEEPQIVSALPPVRPTSWKGCCGLFELFTGSHR